MGDSLIHGDSEDPASKFPENSTNFLIRAIEVFCDSRAFKRDGAAISFFVLPSNIVGIL